LTSGGTIGASSSYASGTSCGTPRMSADHRRPLRLSAPHPGLLPVPPSRPEGRAVGGGVGGPRAL
jgi:hypothetical protein